MKKMSARILSEDTERVRDEIFTHKMDGEEFIALKGQTGSEKANQFERSVIGFASSSMSSNQILDQIIAEGVLGISIHPMGGMLHMITFESTEDKKAMIDSKWLETWFMELRDVTRSCSSLWKETWIKVYGVPLGGWNYNNFYNIGNIFGRVLSVDYSGFECAKILIITDCLFIINCNMLLELEGNMAKVWITEDIKTIYVKEDAVCQKNPFLSSDEEDEKEKGAESADDVEIQNLDDVEVQEEEEGTQNKGGSSPIIETTKGALSNVMIPWPHKNTGDNEKTPIMNQSQTEVAPKHVVNSNENPCNLINDCFSPKKSQTEPGPIISPNKSTPSKISQTTSSNLGDFGPGPIINTHLTFHLPNKIPSPTSISHPTSQSPIKTSNRFGPLLKSNKSSSASSLSSGPMFPPGFEDSILPNLKKAHAQKRQKKLLRKNKKLKLQPDPYLLLLAQPGELTAASVLSIASELGFTYNGNLDNLHSLISDILSNHKKDWTPSNI